VSRSFIKRASEQVLDAEARRPLIKILSMNLCARHTQYFDDIAPLLC
jgi:hypothetical protein